jgi:hypothetical protein
LAKILAVLLLSAAFAVAQQIPMGTVMPVMTTTTIDSAKSKAGQVFVGKVMSEVPLATGDAIPEGSKVYGHVVEVSRSATGIKLALSFDRLVVRRESFPVSANLRALAGMMRVFESQVPVFEPDGAPRSAMLFAPVGGEAAFRPDNPEKSWKSVVRFKAEPAPGCGNRIDEEGGTGALWVFSPYACGVYGFGHSVSIARDGREYPLGRIELASTSQRIEVRAGSGWLLRVASSPLISAK